jgi:RimJ/RimL family protein N-acetyltransferase
MSRWATLADRAAIIAVLEQAPERGMFPLMNLLDHGMAGGHPRAVRFWLWGEPLAGVIGLTEAGMLMPVIPPEAAQEAARDLIGQRVIGLVRVEPGAGALMAATGLDRRPVEMSRAEPQFLLSLSRLTMPAVAGLRLGPLSTAPLDRITAWRAAARVETMGADPATAPAQAAADLGAWLAGDAHRVLWQGDTPVALTGFNARLPGIVQVGAVYVPPAHRNRGLARAAVALHLAEAAAQGVTRATLFAATPAAARAYQALGFARIGDVRLCLFRAPEVIADG